MKQNILIRKILTAALPIVILVTIHVVIMSDAKKNMIAADENMAERIFEEMANSIKVPTEVARVIAHDSFVEEFLKTESADEKSDDERIRGFLKRLKAEFLLTHIAIISEKSRRCYRDDGIERVLSPEKAEDNWFEQFRESEAVTGFAAVKAEESVEKSAIYMNTRINDSSGEFIGIVSVEISMKSAIRKLSDMEKANGVRIFVVDENGLVMVSAIFNDICEESLLHMIPVKSSADGRMTVTDRISEMVFAKPIQCAGWYIIIQKDISKTSTANMLFMLAAAALLSLSLYIQRAMTREQKAPPKIVYGKEDQTDKLTGLPNRNFFKDMFGERGVFNTTRYRCLAVFDIDFFKETNDNANGDEVLVSVVHNMSRLLGDNGMTLRWGGDEFLVLFELPMESALAVCRQFVRNVESDGVVTVSVGLTAVRISDTIKKNYYRAAQYCYFVKEMGGNGVKRD